MDLQELNNYVFEASTKDHKNAPYFELLHKICLDEIYEGRDEEEQIELCVEDIKNLIGK